MELVPPGPTLETYKRHMVTHGFPVDVEELQDFNLLWIGPRTATSVIAYGFGGGYVMPAFDAHFNVLIDGYKIMKSNNEDVSIVIINFGLCPTFPYPSQLRQAIIAIQNLTTTRPASKISLSGDSAGANLMLALLLHLNGHTHPKVPAFSLPSGQKFREAMLISPGAPIQTSATSMNRDPWKDFVTTEMIEHMFGEIQKTSEVELPNPWIANSDVPEEWWKGLPVEGVFVIVGEDEVLRDDILSWCAHLKKYHDGEVLVNVYPGEIHIQVYLDNLMGVTEDKASTKDFKKWFQEFKA